MATKTKTKTGIARRTSGVSVKKYEQAKLAARNSSQRARRVASERMGVIVGMGTGYAVGKYESKGKKLPSVLGIEGTALCGAVLAFGPSLLGLGTGKLGHVAAEAGASLLGIACYKAGKGIAPMVAGEGDEGWSND